MVGRQWIIPIIVSIAILLTIGIMLIWTACAIDGSWLLLIVILFPSFGTLFPCICGGYNFESMPSYLMDEQSSMERLGFFFEGSFLTSGLVLPLVMFRAGSFSSAKPVYLSLAGETCIWASVILYMFAFLYSGRRSNGFGDL